MTQENRGQQQYDYPMAGEINQFDRPGAIPPNCSNDFLST